MEATPRLNPRKLLNLASVLGASSYRIGGMINSLVVHFHQRSKSFFIAILRAADPIGDLAIVQVAIRHP